MSSPVRYLAALAGSALVLTSLASAAPVAHADATIQVKDLVLTVGATSSERGVAWLGGVGVDDHIQLTQVTGRSHHRTTTVAPTSAGTAGEQTGWEWNQATLRGLKTHTTYSYRICSAAGSCTDAHRFRTGSAGNFSFLVYGDPQVYVQKGGNPTTAVVDGWTQTLAESTGAFPKTAFLLTAGDQVDSYNVSAQPAEWDGFLSPEQLTTYGLAPNVGNHDDASTTGYLYAQHFALPNLSTTGQSAAGTGDYWYTYNGVLFLSINSNSLDFAGHEAFLEQAVKAAPKARWRILSFHHAPFSSADHPLDSNVAQIREQFTPVISKLGIDLVLNGHDHDYTRSYLMDGDSVASPQAGGHVTAKPGQVLYITTNSASGGKFYDLTGPYPWAAVTNQADKANYTNVEVTGDALVVTTYEVGGSVIDRVTLTRTKARCGR
ncbi:MAG: metallophosphoesterase family protein [Propionibacteriaceae bacterium]|nr:metallophosphoesterase family protein [Propionibacteriaceae bacterium]